MNLFLPNSEWIQSFRSFSEQNHKGKELYYGAIGGEISYWFRFTNLQNIKFYAIEHVVFKYFLVASSVKVSNSCKINLSKYTIQKIQKYVELSKTSPNHIFYLELIPTSIGATITKIYQNLQETGFDVTDPDF